MGDIYLRCKMLEKADLHLHLNGLFSTEIIKEVLIDEGTFIPSDFKIEQDLNVLNAKRSLARYLKPWDVLRLIPRKLNNLSLLIDSGFDNLSINNIRYVEIRNSIIYLSLLQQKRLEETIELLIHELRKAAETRNIEFRLIITIPRSEYSLVYLNALLTAHNSIGRPKDIVGLDLAGNEEYPIPKNLGKMFKSAKDNFGFKITIHAGETGNLNNIHEAIYLFGADRIGHGTIASNCEKTMELLAKKNICVEVCPISNRRTGAVKSTEPHPVKKFIKNNVPFVLCSDNPGIHTDSLSNDYFDFYKETRRLDILENMYSTQMKYSFK
jgi:adenosine deaminase